IDAYAHLGLEGQIRRVDRAAVRQWFVYLVLGDAARQWRRPGRMRIAGQRRGRQVEALVAILGRRWQGRHAAQQIGSRTALFGIAGAFGDRLDRIAYMATQRTTGRLVRRREIFFEAGSLVLHPVAVVLHDLTIVRGLGRFGL